MRRLAVLVSISLGLSLFAIAPAQAGPGMVVLTTSLNPQEAVPPGDPAGSGDARITVGPHGAVCFVIVANNIGPILAAHIHEAPKGQTGPHAVDLPGRLVALSPTSQLFYGCAFGEARAGELAAHPSRFYVNVHTHEFITGALRGQLGD